MLVLDPAGLDLDWGPDTRIFGLDGRRAGYRTTMDRLVIGTASMSSAPAIIEDDAALPVVDGRHVAVAIGHDILSGAETLIDLPHRRLVLFQYRRTGCPDLRATFAGRSYPTPPHMTDMDRLDAIDATIDGHVIEMQINTGSNESIVSRRVAEAIGVTHQDLLADPRVRTQNNDVRLGQRHTSNRLSISDYAEDRPRIDVLPDITHNPLGLDFFRDKVVLLDIPGARFMFQVVDRTVPRPREDGPSRYGTVQTRHVHVAVDEGAVR